MNKFENNKNENELLNYTKNLLRKKYANDNTFKKTYSSLSTFFRS